MRRVKITEEQRQYALKEGIILNADVTAAGGDVKKAVDTTKQQAQKSGVDLKKATIQINPTDEGRIITKKEIMENRLKHFKENSEYYRVDEFMRRIGRKNVNEGLTNAQIRNITGIYDDDELNAGAEAEEKEKTEDEIWNAMTELAGGNPRKTPFDFKELSNVLKQKFGLSYKGRDDDEECHMFGNEMGTLYIYPNNYYPDMGKLTIYNFHFN